MAASTASIETHRVLQERRSALLKAAEAVFLRDGFHATTMDAVAKTAAMSKKTIYQIFTSKEGLFEALLNERLKPSKVPLLPAGLTPDQALTELMVAMAGHLLHPASIAMYRLVMTEFSGSSSFSRLFQRREPDKSQMELEVWLARLSENGPYRIDNAHEAAQMLIGMALGGFQLALLLGRKRRFPIKTIRARVETSVAIFLAGLRRS